MDKHQRKSGHKVKRGAKKAAKRNVYSGKHGSRNAAGERQKEKAVPFLPTGKEFAATRNEAINMAQKNKAIIIFLALAAIAAGYFISWRKPSAGEVGAAMRRVQDLVVKQGDCYTSLKEADKLIRQDDSLVDAWHWRGICEFQTGKYDDARKSFNKVLELDPGYSAAKTYLNIMGSGMGESLISVPMNREGFESRLGIELGEYFKFVSAVQVAPGPDRTELIIADYETQKNPKDAVTVVSTILKNSGFDIGAVAVKNQKGQSTVYGRKSNLEIAVAVSANQTPTRVSIMYGVLK